MTSFDVALFLEGDGPSDFRFRPRNEPLSPWERRSVLASRSSSSLVVKVKLALAVHGKLSNGDPASLIIVDFDFISMSTPRRFKYAMVEFVFKPEKPGSTCPKLRSIAPSQYYYIQPTKRKVEETHSIGASISAGIPGASASARFTWDMTEESKDSVQAVVASTMSASCGFGDPDSATWVLRENTATKTGIPTRLQVAMLLERDKEAPDQKFLANVNIKTGVDFVSSVRRMFGANPRGHPVVFDPMTSPGPPLPNGINKEKLNETDLNELIDISSS